MFRFESLISTRYLFSGEKRALSSGITLISVLGVAVGVAALIIVIGVMDGAERDLIGKIVESYPHLRVSPVDGQIDNPGALANQLGQIDGVRAAEPVVAEQALFSTPLGARSEVLAGMLLSTENLQETELYRVREVGGGTLQPGPREVVLGVELARELGVETGDTILAIAGLTSTEAARRGSSGKLLVAGLFETGYYQFDILSAFISPETFEQVFSRTGGADYIHIKLSDPFADKEAAAAVYQKLGPGWEITTWEEESNFLYESIQTQKLMLFIILMLIVLVAAFNIIGTLILMIIEKTREIGIMRAMGVRQSSIRRIFLGVGFYIGLMGNLLGVALGLLGVFLLKYVIRLDMPEAVYNFDRLPVTANPVTIAVIAVCAMAMCLLAGLFPATQAGRLNPVEALRHE